MRKARGKYTREKIKVRKANQEKRQKHIQAIIEGSIEEELPEPLLPEVFKGIEELYWERLKAVHEDKVRYKSIDGAMAHISLLNIAWNCLSVAVFDKYWNGESMNYKIQFWKDYPNFNPISGNYLQLSSRMYIHSNRIDSCNLYNNIFFTSSNQSHQNKANKRYFFGWSMGS